MVNVYLLIKNESNRTLLTWRDDGYYKAGWHVPGGIIRYKETIAERIQAVAKTELGTEVEFLTEPLAVNEIIHPKRRERGYFISLLYRCSLTTLPDESLHYESGTPKPNQWMWHETCPENIITVHEIYRRFI
jgi:ADP-ribose pyrophosphatase YjhB (NUDIX family)